MVRLKDIAEACGVSVATVSRALNGLTNENKERTAYICRIAREMGYYPNAAARTLKTSRSNNIGILYENQMQHEYFSVLLDDLRREADLRGYDLTFIGRESGAAPANYYEHARRRNLDGVMVVQADFDSPGVARLATSSIPTVVVDHTYEGCDCVVSDNRKSMEEIVRYAVSLGHRRIAFIHGEHGAVSRDRLAGFYKVCAEMGLKVPLEYVRAGRFHDPGECAELVRKLLALPEKPTCVLCPDDYSCLGALWQLEGMGVNVPEDVSLAGYDGIRMSQMLQPHLTTYRQDTASIAREAVKLLLEAVENPEEHQPRKIIVAGTLVEGETMGRIENHTRDADL